MYLPWTLESSAALALLKRSVIPSAVEESLIVTIPARMNSKRCLDCARHDRKQLFNRALFALEKRGRSNSNHAASCMLLYNT